MKLCCGIFASNLYLKNNIVLELALDLFADFKNDCCQGYWGVTYAKGQSVKNEFLKV